MLDYYKILGVNETATEDEIKFTYRRLAMQYHPDKTGGDIALEQKFKEVQKAYEILSDTAKRFKYDQSRLTVLLDNHYDVPRKRKKGTAKKDSLHKKLIKRTLYYTAVFIFAIYWISRFGQMFQDAGTNVPKEVVQDSSDKLLTQIPELRTGAVPLCCKSLYSESDLGGSIAIHAKKGTDVVVKIMSFVSQKAARCVYVTGGTSYVIRKIPKGIYFIKTAEGNKWTEESKNGECVRGYFVENPDYNTQTGVYNFTNGGEYILDLNTDTTTFRQSDENTFNKDGE